MITELFLPNLASMTITFGGMSSPPPGTIETMTVEEERGGVLPIVHRGIDQFHFKDRNPTYGSEIFTCLATDGNNWTVERGAEETLPIAHHRKFTIRQVITSAFLQRLGAGSTTELVNAVTVCGADPSGETLSDEALASALDYGPVYLPSGVYAVSLPLNVLPGQSIISFGSATIRPTSDFIGDSVIEVIDGSGSVRLENITLDGTALGGGSDVYGIFAETQRLEAEFRSIRISGFPNSGVILSGSGWVLDRVSCSRNFGSGFELNLDSSLIFGCRSTENARYGFVGHYLESPIGCIVKGNKLGDMCLTSR